MKMVNATTKVVLEFILSEDGLVEDSFDTTDNSELDASFEETMKRMLGETLPHLTKIVSVKVNSELKEI